jgi:hypothetical protein
MTFSPTKCILSPTFAYLARQNAIWSDKMTFLVQEIHFQSEKVITGFFGGVISSYKGYFKKLFIPSVFEYILIFAEARHV